MHTTEGVWLNITDYSAYKKVSISTIRRHLKSKVLQSRVEDGKYLIYVPHSEKIKLKEEEEILKLKLEIEFLKIQLREVKDEAAELRMLVDLYEAQGKNSNRYELPPEVPTHI
jgi:thiamine phosphate synthase YjbQ (UPF0047 family)